MSDIMAAIGIVQLSRLEEFSFKRRNIAKIYDYKFKKINLLQLYREIMMKFYLIFILLFYLKRFKETIFKNIY